MTLERSIQLKVLLSPAEKRMLAQLAKVDGLTASDVVRQLVRRAHAALVPPEKHDGKTRKRSRRRGAKDDATRLSA